MSTFFNKGKADKISKRELEVLRLVARGQSQDEAARALFISTETSKHRLKRLRQKLGAATTPEAVYKAMKLQLIE